MTTLTLTQPDDWHVHLRDGAVLAQVVADTARCFRRAMIMPNLRPAVTTTAQAIAYRERIIAAIPAGLDFEPLLTLYLTDQTAVDEIKQAHASGLIHGIKLYPAGATTNSAAGVTDIYKTYATLAVMEELGVPLLVHGEVVRSEVDVFDREKVFIDEILLPLCTAFPRLRLVLEHITTADAVQFVESASAYVGATITAHHLLLNRNQMFSGGIRPHYYCLPILKRERHRLALVAAAISANPKFFLGTDSAPHGRQTKEASCGCAGIYTAPLALELYAEVFEQADALDKLEGFASFYGADFYGLERNKTTITLHKKNWTMPDQLPFGKDIVIPMRAGEQVVWQCLPD